MAGQASFTPSEGTKFKIEKTSSWADESMEEYKIIIDGLTVYCTPSQLEQLFSLDESRMCRTRELEREIVMLKNELMRTEVA